MATLQLFFSMWFFYLAGAAVPLLACMVKCAKKLDVAKEEVLVLFLPYSIWWSLMLINAIPKSLSNLIEAPIIGAIVSFLFLLLRVFWRSIGFSSKIYLVASCIASALIYFFTPGLPE